MNALSLAAGLALAAPIAAQGQVWVVDDVAGPGVDFTSVKAAVTAAADGDVVLIQDGSYEEGVVILAKSLALVGERGAVAALRRGLLAVGLQAGQWLLVRGVDSIPLPAPLTGDGIRLAACFGTAWIEDGFFYGGLGTGFFPSAGAYVQQCASAAFVRCDLIGGPGVPPDVFGTPVAGDGLSVSAGSFVALYDSSAMGLYAPAALSLYQPAGAGGNGAWVSESTFYASGCVFRGGAGGAGGPLVSGGCSTSGPGGDGVHVSGPGGAIAYGLANSYAGGAAGTPVGTCSSGAPGQPIGAFPGEFQPLAGPARSLVVPAPLREGESFVAEARGAPGELVVVAGSSTQPAGSFVAAWSSVLWLGVPYSLQLAGVVPASGTLAIPSVAAALPPGFDSGIRYLQPAFVAPPTLAVSLGAPTALVVLDASF